MSVSIYLHLSVLSLRCIAWRARERTAFISKRTRTTPNLLFDVQRTYKNAGRSVGVNQQADDLLRRGRTPFYVDLRIDTIVKEIEAGLHWTHIYAIQDIVISVSSWKLFFDERQ